MTDSQAFFGFNKFHSTDQIFSWMFLSWICLLFSTLDWGYVFWRKTTEIKYHFHHIRASQVAQKQRIRLPMQETQEVQVWSLGQAGPLDGPFQCSCLENPTDRGAWWVTKCQTRLSHWVCASARMSAHTHALISRVHQHDSPWLMLTLITWLRLCWGNPHLYSLYSFSIWLKFAYWGLCPSIAALHLEF